MINDMSFRKANCKMKKLVTEGVPKLCLFTIKDIHIGDEITCCRSAMAVSFKGNVCILFVPLEIIHIIEIN